MSKWLVLLGVAIAALLGLLALLYSLGPRSFESNYTLTIIFETPTESQRLDLGWILMGIGDENYTIAVLKLPGAEIQIFTASERGKEHNLVCVAGRCARDVPPREVDISNFRIKKIGVVGRCRHLGLEGELVRGEVEYDWGLLSEIARQRGVNMTAEGEVCVAGHVILWIREKYTLTAYGQQASMIVIVNATRVGPYSAERYREVLNRVKSS